MEQKNTIGKLITENIHLIILGISLALSVCGFLIVNSIDANRLNAFGPTAKIYFYTIKNGLMFTVAFLGSTFVLSLFFKNFLKRTELLIRNFYKSLSTIKKNSLILIICLIFSFATHANNIVNGYFNMDDFQVIGVNRLHTFPESLLITHGNDHTMPLFNTEMRVMDYLFGQNPIPFNVGVFLLFALIPFFTYLTFKRLNIGTFSFFIFLILFSGATNWADMLTGFNIMSTYTQIIFFFSLAMWGYISWQQTKRAIYAIPLAIGLIGSITIDLPGIWTTPALLLFMVYVHHRGVSAFRINKDFILGFIKENKTPLLIVATISIAFGIFLVYTFGFLKPNSFLSGLNGDGISSTTDKAENWKPIPLASNFLSFFANGVSLSVFAPSIAKIVAHPSIQNSVKHFWPLLEIFILLINVTIFVLTLKYSENKDKKLIIFLTITMSMVMSMVIIARPNHNPIPDFDYRYAGASYYFYCIFLALCSSILIRRNKNLAVKIILPILILSFSAQQIFSFYTVSVANQSKQRKQALTTLNDTLLKELDTLSKEKGSLTIPNLSGAHIFEATSGFTLANYILFFDKKSDINLIQNIEMPPDVDPKITISVPSLRASTSEAFKTALKNSPIVRDYYGSSGLMIYSSTSTKPDSYTKQTKNTLNGDVLVRKGVVNPERENNLKFSMQTENIPGNLEVAISFKNDFDLEGKMGKIRIDDYTPYFIEDNKRIYLIETNLLQLYPYSLSETISNIILNIPETKGASIGNLNFN